MLATLHLLITILKFCLTITLFRLASTAFGWEFGVSRQYLRLLELLFQVGQKRIEKVESEHKLQFLNGHSKLEDSELVDSVKLNGNCVDRKCEMNEQDQDGSENDNAELHDCERRRRRTGVVSLPNAKLRRICNPDGPPVFLLDDYDDDDDDEKDDNKNDNDLNNLDQETISGELCGDWKIRRSSSETKQHEFQITDASKFVVRGISAIIDDQVTKRFTTEELKTWNLLTRTNAKNYQFMSRSLGLVWFLGFLVRYAILMPLRILFTLTGFLWLICTTGLIGLLPRNLRSKPYRLTSLMSFRMLSCGITSRLEFHNRQYRAKMGDICVANHTSPIDVVVLACDNCYALVGQRHGGVLGILEHALSRATKHVWFDRGEMRDRQLVTQRLKEHISSKSNLPVLIFPEGTCINNSAVMMFRKGSFETTNRVCPVAIKYDPRFGDPFWNSSKQSYVQYLFLMMSSWAIKCDVWYLPPMERLPDESSAEFANRVKAEIARQGGLEDLAWDGQLKRSAPKVVWKYQQQEDFVKRLKLE